MKHAPVFALACTFAAAGCTHGPDADAPPTSASTEPGAASQPSPHGHKHHGHDRHHRFDNPEQWAERFEDPKRDAWQKPEVVLELMALKKTDVVADIGAATGYFPVRIAPHVATVYGVDIEPEMVKYLDERAAKEGLANVKGVLGATDDPRIPEPVDVVLLVDTYHHIDARTEYFGRVKERLKAGGRLVIVDFKKGELPMGPPDAMKLAEDVVEKELTAAGYVLKTKESERLPYQYVLVFEAAP